MLRTDPLGHSVRNSHDDAGRLTSTTDALVQLDPLVRAPGQSYSSRTGLGVFITMLA